MSKDLKEDAYDPPCVVGGSDKDNHDEDSPTLDLTENSKVIKPVSPKIIGIDLVRKPFHGVWQVNFLYLYLGFL